jgi:hypothetical protein
MMNVYEQHIIRTMQDFSGSCMIQTIQSNFHNEFINEDNLNRKLAEALRSLLASGVLLQPNQNVQMYTLDSSLNQEHAQ